MATVAKLNRIESLAKLAKSRILPPTNRAAWIDEATAQEMLDLTLDAIRKALSSGVKKYNIGSRGLERYALDDLYKMLDYWREVIDDAKGGGTSIKSKRIVPSDW
jgi:hypothetical protein